MSKSSQCGELTPVKCSLQYANLNQPLSLANLATYCEDAADNGVERTFYESLGGDDVQDILQISAWTRVSVSCRKKNISFMVKTFIACL